MSDGFIFLCYQLADVEFLCYRIAGVAWRAVNQVAVAAVGTFSTGGLAAFDGFYFELCVVTVDFEIIR